MKIAAITTVPLESHGITTFLLNAYPHVDAQVDLVSPVATDATVAEQLRQLGINVHCLAQVANRKTNPGQYLRTLIALLKNGDYDAVHIHGNSGTMTMELVAAVMAGIPKRAVHSHNTTCNTPWIHHLLRPALNQLATVRLACGDAAGTWQYGQRAFTVVPNAIDLEAKRYDPKAGARIRQQLQIADHQILIGHVGAFNRQKNQGFILDLAQAMQDLAQYQFVLLGSGETQAALEAERVSRGLGNVHFVGQQQDVESYMSAMDAFILPSLHEGLPFVLVEALAAGLPCLVSDQVAKEARLTAAVQFLPLTQVSAWVTALGRLEPENRVKVAAANIQTLTARGFNTTTMGAALMAALATPS